MASLAIAANSQVAGLTGRKPKIPLNQVLVSQIPAAREIERNRVSLKQAQDQFDQEQSLQAEIANTQAAGAKTASMIQGANLAMTLGTATKDSWMPAVKETAGKVADGAMPAVKNGITSLKKILTGAPAAETAAPVVATGATEALPAINTHGLTNLPGAEPSAIGNSLTSATPQVATDASLATAANAADVTMAPLDSYTLGGNTSTLSAEAGLTGTAPTVAPETSPFGGAAGTAAAVIAYIAAAEMARGLWGGKGQPYDEKTKQQRVVDSPVTSGVMLSVAPGTTIAPDGTVAGDAYKNMSALNRTAMAPIDWVFGESTDSIRENFDTAVNAIQTPFGRDAGTAGQVANVLVNPAGYAASRCIIVTACTSPDSPEVNITREYRDKFLTPEELRGYYMIAEKTVPLIHQSPLVRRLIKSCLVDPLIACGRFELGYTRRIPSLFDRLVKRSFLGLCRLAGRTRSSFVRLNGEIV